MRTFALSALLAFTFWSNSVLNAQDNVKANQGGFVKRHDYAVGSEPYGIATGDFNGDSFLDLVVANQSGSISVLFGDSRGSFSRSSNYPAAPYVSGVATADLDGDGHVDIVTANGDPLRSSVSVFRNHGDGTFAPHVDYFTNDRDSTSVAIADLDSDGVLDLAVVGCSPLSGACDIGDVAIFPGNGNGTFRLASHHTIGPMPTSVAAADLNGDGFVDLIAAEYTGEPQTNIAVLLGTGGGNFTPEVGYAGRYGSRCAVLGDFNQDGKLDIAVSNLSTNTITLLPGVGDGTFGLPQVTPARAEPWCLTVGDFDLDGRPDIATTNYTAYSVSIFLNKGSGQFSTPFTYAVGRRPFSIVAGDFNSDGKPDVATANFFDGTVTVLLSLRAR
jgi:FG-GAP-like repeat/FG-GAP repeat